MYRILLISLLLLTANISNLFANFGTGRAGELTFSSAAATFLFKAGDIGTGNFIWEGNSIFGDSPRDYVQLKVATLTYTNEYLKISTTVTDGIIPKMVFMQNGYIGISSHNPQGLLVVGSGHRPAVTVLPGGNVGISNADPLATLSVQGAVHMFSGNVGVGNTNPLEQLDVTGNASLSGILVASTSVRSPVGNFDNVNTSMTLNNIQIGIYGSSITALDSSMTVVNNYILTNSTNSIELNFQKSTTTALNNYQEVTSSNSGQIASNTNWINLFSTNSAQINSNTNFINVTSSNSGQIKTNTDWIILNSSNIARWDLIGTVVSTTAWYCDGTNQWNSNIGNVGIGTTKPNAKLDVLGDIKTLGNISSTGTVTFNDGFSVLDSTSFIATITETFRPTGVYQEGLSNPGATTYWNDTGYLIDNDTMTYAWINVNTIQGNDIIVSNFGINLDANAVILNISMILTSSFTVIPGAQGFKENSYFRKNNYNLQQFCNFSYSENTLHIDKIPFSSIPTVGDLNSSTFSVVLSQIDPAASPLWVQTYFNDVYLEITYIVTTSSVFTRGYVTTISSSGDTRIQTEGSILPYYNCEAERVKCNIGSANYYWNEMHYHTAVTHSFEDKVTENDAINTIKGIKLDQKNTFGKAFVAKKKKPIKVKQGKKIITQEITDEDSKEGTDVNTVIEMLIKTNQYLLKEIEKKKDK